MEANNKLSQSSYDGPEINFGNKTDVGRKRQVNEDYFANFKTNNGHVFLVCDGMGGHVGGEKASRIAVEAIRNYLTEKTESDILQLFSAAIIYANTSILEYSKIHPELKGMGSTCVGLLVKDGKYYVAHVGDSRAYLYRGGSFRRLTKDHSFVQGLIDIGEISEEDANNHPRKNEITNALGIERMKPPTVTELTQPQKDDLILLCSDGLTGMVKDCLINSVLSEPLSLQDKAEKLVKLANDAGGFDNITVQIIETVKSKRHKKIRAVSKKKSTHDLLKIKPTHVTLLVGICIGFFVAGVLGNINEIKNLFSLSGKTMIPTSQPESNILPDTSQVILPDTVRHGDSDLYMKNNLMGLQKRVRDLQHRADSLSMQANKLALRVYSDSIAVVNERVQTQKDMLNSRNKEKKDALDLILRSNILEKDINGLKYEISQIDIVSERDRVSSAINTVLTTLSEAVKYSETAIRMAENVDEMIIRRRVTEGTGNNVGSGNSVGKEKKKLRLD